MRFEDIKISSTGKKPEEKSEKESKERGYEDSDYVIKDAAVGSEILNKIKGIAAPSKEIIYGVYNNADQPLFVRINDFLIDHSRVTLKDKSYFFHMLAVMVDAGIPVVQAVSSLSERTENKRFARILNTIAYNCERGNTLADAMSRFEDVFDESEIGIVRSGEATGRLDRMLFKLSVQLDKSHDLYLKLWGAAIYPIAVIVVLILVAVGMLVWIFPTLLNLLEEGGVGQGKLPLPTKILLFLQTAIVGFWWLILLVLLVLYGLFSMYVRSDYGATKWDYFKLRFPVLGNLLKKLYVLRFVTMLGLLIDAGLPVLQSLKITGNSLANRLYKIKTQEVIDDVRVGHKISDSLMDSEFLFPPEIRQMINVGEKSASLAKISEKIGNQYEREIDSSLKQLTSVFEPVMILVVGLFVALLALAIMAPIFNLSSVVGT